MRVYVSTTSCKPSIGYTPWQFFTTVHVEHCCVGICWVTGTYGPINIYYRGRGVWRNLGEVKVFFWKEIIFFSQYGGGGNMKFINKKHRTWGGMQFARYEGEHETFKLNIFVWKDMKIFHSFFLNTAQSLNGMNRVCLKIQPPLDLLDWYQH